LAGGPSGASKMRASLSAVAVLIETLCIALSGAERLGDLRGGDRAPAPALPPSLQPALVAAPAPAPVVAIAAAPASAGHDQPGQDAKPHFMANTYGFLKRSGDRVGSAVQRILGVQGRLDDMVEDLSHEYTRWQLRQKELLLERGRLNQEMGLLESQAMKNRMLHMQQDRLSGDLGVQITQRARLAAQETVVRHQWVKEQTSLRDQISDLTVKIEAKQKYRAQRLAAIATATNANQEQHREAQNKIALLNKELSEFQESRVKQMTARAKEHSGLLKTVGALQDDIKALQKELLYQAQLQVEQRRLEAQTREVVQQREAYERSRVNCTQTLSALDASVAAAKRSLEGSNAAIIECQGLDVGNQNLQRQLSECRAASVAGQG